MNNELAEWIVKAIETAADEALENDYLKYYRYKNKERTKEIGKVRYEVKVIIKYNLFSCCITLS